MDQLRQADVGQGEDINSSVQAANYAPLTAQMDLGSKLMQSGFAGAASTQRQLMAEDAVRQRDVMSNRREDMLSRRKEMDAGDEYEGTLTQMIAEMDDIVDSADMNDPVVADRVGSIVRKRNQLEQLLSKGAKPAYLGGIIKQGTESGMLSAQAQGEVGQMRGQAPQKESEQKKPAEQKAEKPKEEANWSDNPASNEIN